MNNVAYDVDSTTAGPGSSPSSSQWFQNIVERAKEILFTPDLAWDKIKNEKTSITDIYKNYLLVIAAIAPICFWIKYSIFGFTVLGVRITLPFFGGLVTGILQYGASLAMVYLAALALEKLAPLFDGKAEVNNTFKLLAYAGTPSAIASIFTIVPVLGTLVAIAGAVYTIYIFFKGLPKLINIPLDKRIPYLATSIVVILLIGFITMWTVDRVSPGIDRTQLTIQSSGGTEQIDLRKLEQRMLELQKGVPKP